MMVLGDAGLDVYEQLSAARPTDRVLAVARAALGQHGAGVDCPVYMAAIESALDEEPPPFGTDAYADIYHTASSDGQWMAVSLMTNAEREGDGATRLWSLAACSSDSRERQLLKRHAVDESRHALAYLALLDLCFPAAVTPSFREELNRLSPGYAMRQKLLAVEGSPYAKAPTIDDFLQMNIAEIRTAIHHLMQRPALAAHCPPESRSRTTMIQQALLRDELNHVAYTAVRIEQLTQSATPREIDRLFAKRFRDFNRITSEELGDKLMFDCSVACCAKRPECRAKASASAHN